MHICILVGFLALFGNKRFLSSHLYTVLYDLISQKGVKSKKRKTLLIINLTKGHVYDWSYMYRSSAKWSPNIFCRMIIKISRRCYSQLISQNKNIPLPVHYHRRPPLLSFAWRNCRARPGTRLTLLIPDIIRDLVRVCVSKIHVVFFGS